MTTTTYLSNILKSAAMHDLVIHGQFSTLIADDQHPDTSPSIIERIRQPVQQVALIKNRKSLLDISRLGHGNHTTILTNVKNTVLLEDRSNHVLNNHRGGRVGDERGLLLQLLGEEVHSQVAVLTSLSGGGDADDLTAATLQDQEITNADVVAGDGDGVGGGDGAAGRVFAWGRHGDFTVTDDDIFFTFDAVLVLVVTSAFEGVEDAIGGLVETVTERVVVAVLVVVSHVLFGVGRTSVDGGAFYLDGFGESVGRVVLARRGRLVLPITRRAVLFDEGGGTVTKVSLGNVDARVEVDLSGWRVTSRVLAVVFTVLNVDLSFGVPLIWFTVSDGREREVSVRCHDSTMGGGRSLLTVRRDGGKKSGGRGVCCWGDGTKTARTSGMCGSVKACLAINP